MRIGRPSRLRRPLTALAAAFPALVSAQATGPARPGAAAAPRPTATYWVYVGAESADLIHRVRFGPAGATVEKTIPAGEHPTEMEGPHGLQISKDGRFLHMSTGHGMPDGKYWKYELGPDTLVGDPILLGNFPASLDVTADGLYAFIGNFNLHGEMVPSSVSVVYTPTNTEVARPTTCVMPHGSRLDHRQRFQWSTCMMDDQLVAIDARTFAVARRFSVATGHEGPIAPGAYEEMMAAMLPADSTGGSPARMAMMHPVTCSPTWAQPAAASDRVYVACNKSDEILEVDVDRMALARRFKAGRGPYNLAVTPDGRLLVATLKPGSAVEVFDLAAGVSVARIPTSTTLAHGVVVSPDSRYAFVTAEGVGAQPGKVDVIDLRARRRVASVDVGQQASGIAFWRMEEAVPPRVPPRR